LKMTYPYTEFKEGDLVKEVYYDRDDPYALPFSCGPKEEVGIVIGCSRPPREVSEFRIMYTVFWSGRKVILSEYPYNLKRIEGKIK
jgi:hypothetical protein